ncbi:hypothetical protein ABK040_002711 [Willaertia magna]
MKLSPLHHFISIKQLSPKLIESLCSRAHQFKIWTKQEQFHRFNTILKNKIINLLFFEPSTRTQCSFQSAIYRLGGQSIILDINSSSSNKGETLQDTIRVMEQLGDLTILRHPKRGVHLELSPHLEKPLINAGDGDGEHPTQSLLDLFTIREEQQRLTLNYNFTLKTICMFGDLLYGRTVHSLLQLLSIQYQNQPLKIYLISPNGLKMPLYVVNEVKNSNSSFEIIETEELTKEIMSELDVLYVTRLQKERFLKEEEYLKYKSAFCLTKEDLKYSKNIHLPIIMHPLPRVNELDIEIDKDERAAYFRQVNNGVFMRMAILERILCPESISQ